MPPTPDNESARLAALNALNVLDTQAEASFDRIVNLVATVMDVPIAALCLLDSDRVWFKASKGLAVQEIPRESALCTHAVMQREMVIIPDTSKDARCGDIKLIVELKLKFYAGMPLVTRHGQVIGTLCAADRQPREMTAAQIQSLQDLAGTATDLLETRQTAADLQRAQTQVQRTQERLSRLTTIARCQTEASLDGILVVDNDRSIVSYNQRFVEMWELSTDALATGCDQTVINSILDRLEDPEGFLAGTEKLYEHPDRRWHDEVRLRDGRTFDRYTAAAYGENGVCYGRIWFFRDITETKRYEKQLEQHKLVVENSNAVLFRWRAEEGWPVELVSENISQFGYSAEELLDGRVDFASMIFPEDIERVMEEVKHFSQIGLNTFEQEYRMTCRDGSVRWVYDRTAVERSADGTITHYQGIVIDITERKSNEECALRLLRDLEERVKEMRTLNSILNMMHETGHDVHNVLQQVVDTLPGGFLWPNNTGAAIRYGDATFTSAGFVPSSSFIERSFHCGDGTEGTVHVNLQGLGSEHYGPSLFLDEERQLVTTIAGLLGSHLDRMREQQQLQQQKLVVENSNTVLFRWRMADGWPVDMVSDNVRRFGYESSELLNGRVKFETLVHPDDRRRIETEVLECCESGAAFVEQEYRVICRDGEVRWVFDRTTVERDADGSVTHFQGTVVDITDRKLIEDALRISEERLRNIASQVPGAVYQFRIEPDGSRSFPYISEGVHQLCGVTPEELDKDSMAIMAGILPEEVEAVDASILESARTMQPWSSEFRIRHRNGSIRWIGGNSVPQREPDGSVLWHGLIMDITERKEAEAKVRGLTAIIQASTDFIGRATSDGKLLFINPAGRRMIGLSLDEPLSESSIYEYSPPWAAQRLIEESVPVAVRDGAWVGETALLHRDGHEIPVSQLVIAHKNAQGQVEYISTVIRDATIQKQMHEALKAARDAAEAASLAKSEFLANMSHEIRTPLTAILGYAELLRNDRAVAASAEERNETVQTIFDAGRHLLSVINDILDISKIEAGELSLDVEDTFILDVVREVTNLLHGRAAEKGIDLRVRLRTPVPDRVAIDSTRLKQILMNLAGNAVKFTDTGSVTIGLGVEASGDHANLLMDIEDTGPGMTPQQQSRLFTAFFQGDSSMTRKHGGTGLGLIISRRLATLLEGDVRLMWSEPGRGSCFRVQFKLKPVDGAELVHAVEHESTPVLPKQREPEKPIGLSGRIMLAEDGPENQRLIAFHLRKAGAEVDVADNGEAALAMIRLAVDQQRPYDLLVTDIQMPEMDGCTLARTLREEGSTMPIIALTAHAMAEDRKRCLAAGCDDYATKPIDRARLLEVCHAWLGDRGGRIAA